MTHRLLCFGLGYSARYLADRLRRRGFSVVGTCRKAEGTVALREAGVEPLIFDGQRPLAAEAFAGVTHVLSSIPPDPRRRSGLAARTAAGSMSMRSALAWIGYLSTTGVYGDTGGGWVDETAPTAPSNDRSQRRVVAEQQWLGLWRRHGAPAHVFRLPGIYGPGRSAIEQVRSGAARRIDKPGQVFSRIHVEDIAATLEASIDRPRGGAIYNVADDEPANRRRRDRLKAFELDGPAGAAGQAPYDQIAPTMSPMARSFYADNRRVRNIADQGRAGRASWPIRPIASGLRAILTRDCHPERSEG